MPYQNRERVLFGSAFLGSVLFLLPQITQADDVFDPVSGIPGLFHGTEAATPSCSIAPVTRYGLQGSMPEDVRFEEGQIAAEAGNLGEAYDIFEYLADHHDDPRAQFALARMLEHGLIPPPVNAVYLDEDFVREPDPERARNYLNRAAESGLDEAKLVLVQDLLEEGEDGSPADLEAASDLLSEIDPATAGYDVVLAHLLDMKNEPKAAMEHYHSAADKGNKDALYILARAYCYGDGVAPDMERAVSYWALAHADAVERDFTWDLFTCPSYQALSPEKTRALRERVVADIRNQTE